MCGKETEIEAEEDLRRPLPHTRQSDAKCASVCTPADPSLSVNLCVCDYFAEERHCHESPAAPAVVMLTLTHVHTHTNRRNESCWELRLCSIRITTYLQTLRGKLPLCDSSAKRHTCTFDSRPASPNGDDRGRVGTERCRQRRREMIGCGQNDEHKHTHECWLYICEQPHKQTHVCTQALAKIK